MSKFEETKKSILGECTSNKKTFNRALFNQLGTAILNDPDYEKEECVVKKGELEKVVSEPIKDLRKSLIGSVAKAAGSDAVEQQKLIDEHQFPVLPLYDYVDSVMQEYLGTNHVFVLGRKENFQGKIEFSNQKEQTKNIRKVGSTETKQQKHGAFIKLKATSTCPSNLREDI